MRLFSFSGGLAYHLKALNNKKLWKPFQQDLRIFFSQIQTASSRLVLIGPSAGYNLPPEFLQKFAAIEAIEKDVLAKPIFKHQHPGLNVHWQLSGFKFDQAQDYARIVSSADTVLFANVIGQLGGELSEERHRVFRNLFDRHFKTWELLSIHDLYSADRPFSNSLLGLRESPLAPDELRLDSPSSSEVVDHLTWNLIDSADLRFICQWQISRQRFHLIECIWRRADKTGQGCALRPQPN